MVLQISIKQGQDETQCQNYKENETKTISQVKLRRASRQMKTKRNTNERQNKTLLYNEGKQVVD